MSDWMNRQDSTDVQQAINTQAIQTVLERSVAGVNDPNIDAYMRANFRGVRLVSNTNEGIGTAVWQILSFNTIEYNYGGFLVQGPAGANPYSNIVFPDPGIYSLYGMARFNFNHDYLMQFGLNGNIGAASDAALGSQLFPTNGSLAPGGCVNGFIVAKAGDRISLNVFQQPGVSNTFNPAVFAVHKVASITEGGKA